jgi:prepilin-type N-terminal cleavage/methylation domain-containing protein
MQLSNVYKNNQGFTLPEVLVVILIVGILSAISGPSFLGRYQRQQVNEALTQVQGALKETQREAIKRSRSCSANLNSNTLSGSCLVTGNRNLNNVSVRGASTFEFDFKGNHPSEKIIVVSPPNSYINQKCLVVSNGIGIMRTGNYPDNDSGTSGQCSAS